MELKSKNRYNFSIDEQHHLHGLSITGKTTTLNLLLLKSGIFITSQLFNKKSEVYVLKKECWRICIPKKITKRYSLDYLIPIFVPNGIIYRNLNFYSKKFILAIANTYKHKNCFFEFCANDKILITSGNTNSKYIGYTKSFKKNNVTYTLKIFADGKVLALLENIIKHDFEVISKII